MLKRKISNIGLGVCYILKKNSCGYLIYSENNIEHFIITLEIKDNSFYCTSYYKSLDKALDDFNKLECDDISSDIYRKQIEESVMLDNYLDDILCYSLDTLNYLESSNKNKYDVKEIIMYLSSIPETIESIRKIVKKIYEDR